MDSCRSELGEQFLIGDWYARVHHDDERSVEQKESSSKESFEERAYHHDWLIVVAIYLAVLFDCVQSLNWVHLWKAPETFIVDLFTSTALQIGMPLFFHISGRAQALCKQKDMRSLALDRLCRLAIPFVFCYLLLVPSWRYIHQQFDEGVSDSWLQFQIRFFEPQSFMQNFNPVWLWLLPVLFFTTVLTLPLFRFMEAGGLVNFALNSLWLAIATGCRRYLGMSRSFALLLLLIPALPAAVACLVPFPARCESSQTSSIVPFRTVRRQWLAIRATTWLSIFLSLGVVSCIHYVDLGPVGRNVPGIAMYAIFYIQGYCTVRWNSNINQSIDSSIQAQLPEALRFRVYVRVYETVIAFFMVLVLMLGAPIGLDKRHELREDTMRIQMYFPIYSAEIYNELSFAVFHVLGTWSWLIMAVTLGEAYLYDEVHSTLYKHLTTSSMVVYIFHYIFIKPYAFYVVEAFDLRGGWWNLFHIPIAFSIGVAGALLVYAMCLRCRSLGRLVGL